MGQEHLTVEREVVTLFDRVTCTETWQGTYSDCKAKQKNYLPGRQASCPDINDVWPSGVGVQPTVYCAAARCRRTPGGLGVCTIVYQALFNASVAGLDLAEVSKPIKTWKANAANVNERPDLGQIEQWEKQKEDNYEAYAAYKYDGMNPMTGNTKKLAEMIFAGIESYSEYLPVITVTMSYYIFPQGAPDVGSQLGKKVTPTIPSSYTPVNGNSDLPTKLKPAWVATADRASTNNDGSVTRVQQWTGFDSVNENLYPTPD